MSKEKEYQKQDEQVHVGGLAVKTQSTALAAMNEQQLIDVLRNSLYPGAQTDSIKLVIGYCKASGLDPMQKPVHIVPMDVSVKNDDGTITKVKRDVVMPGIGLYRTQAARTNLYAGMSEPEYGPTKEIAVQRKQWNNARQGDKTFTMVDDGKMEFPEWCKITVKRIVGNVAVDFTAKEFWLENYATAGNDTTAPNSMWKRRPYAQIAKCAEAQALRKAFPELGSAPTADEMEGKSFDEPRDITPQKDTPTDYQTGTERLRNAVVPTKLDDVLKAITAAETPEQMTAAAELAKKLDSDDAKEAANLAYKARLAELKGKPVTVDHESGEVVKDDKSKAPKVTYAQIAAKLNKASDSDNLGAAADLIQYCTGGADQVEELNRIYKARRDEFKEGGAL
jgi:phage recombination protein Bet